jgi:16S rRNA (adenine1518-N6/adenine1519-N6)-dimethyltransferase
MNSSAEKEQHFLQEEKILDLEIKEAKLKAKDKVIEIGAGDGRLTKRILNKKCEVISFETDETFKSELEKIKKENSKLKLIFEDAKKHGWEGANKIVANIPYSMSEPLIHKMISEGIEEGVLIIGENFKKILETKETKAGIIANLYFNFKFICKIDKKHFKPVPRVDSWMISFKEKKANKKEKILRSVVERNGKIKNAIIYALVESGKTKNQAREFILSSEIHEGVLEKPVQSLSGRVLEKIRESLNNQNT